MFLMCMFECMYVALCKSIIESSNDIRKEDSAVKRTPNTSILSFFCFSPRVSVRPTVMSRLWSIVPLSFLS